ncbi:MAG: DNA gyrase modulator, partial [Candidatus Marinimicrobia bacterium]|nr:DNA gyrase modulator [Candidatus Neomarinimicrobiota bacterium]
MKRREFIKAGSIITAGVLTMPWWMESARAEKLAIGSIQNMEEIFGVTKAEMKKLIATAMSHGAEFADLFFEYRISAALRMEEDIIKDVSRGIVMGLGVRAVQGDQVGYAYTDELSFEKMNAAALAASYIASTTAGMKTINVISAPKKDLYSLKEMSIDADLNTKLGL